MVEVGSFDCVSVVVYTALTEYRFPSSSTSKSYCPFALSNLLPTPDPHLRHLSAVDRGRSRTYLQYCSAVNRCQPFRCYNINQCAAELFRLPWQQPPQNKDTPKQPTNNLRSRHPSTGRTPSAIGILESCAWYTTSIRKASSTFFCFILPIFRLDWSSIEAGCRHKGTASKASSLT